MSPDARIMRCASLRVVYHLRDCCVARLPGRPLGIRKRMLGAASVSIVSVDLFLLSRCYFPLIRCRARARPTAG